MEEFPLGRGEREHLFSGGQMLTPELDQLACVADLRAVAAALRAGAAGAAGLRVADRLESYLNHARDGVSIEDALGVKAGAGGEAWWTAKARRERDGALVELQRRVPGADLGRQIRAYERGRWQRDRKQGMPAAYAGDPQELLYLAFLANESVAPGRMPSSDDFLRRLGASLCGATGKAPHQSPPIRAANQMLSIGSEENFEAENAHVAIQDNPIAARRRGQR
jgi:hypothetical protein